MECPPKKKCGHCGEVAVSGGSAILHFFLLVLWRKLQEFYPIFRSLHFD